jgi:hypothetical protein
MILITNKRGSVAQQDASKRLLVKKKAIKVLLDTGLSVALLFMEIGSTRCIAVSRRAVPESWSTSNNTFKATMVGNVCVCVCLTSSRGGLPSDTVSTAR